MSMDVNNNVNNTEVNEDVAAFQADVAMEDFAHRVETGAFTQKEMEDINIMMS